MSFHEGLHSILDLMVISTTLLGSLPVPAVRLHHPAVQTALPPNPPPNRIPNSDRHPSPRWSLSSSCPRRPNQSRPLSPRAVPNARPSSRSTPGSQAQTRRRRRARGPVVRSSRLPRHLTCLMSRLRLTASSALLVLSMRCAKRLLVRYTHCMREAISLWAP